MSANRRIAYKIRIPGAALALIAAAVTTSAVTALPAQAAPPRIHQAATSPTSSRSPTSSPNWRLFDTISLKHQFVIMTRITVVSGDDAWALGVNGKTPASRPTALVEHWNGQAWRRIQPPAKLLARFSKTDIVQEIGASSASNAWVFTSTGKYLRLDGRQWTYGQVPRVKSGILLISDIQVFSPSDVWAFGCRAPSVSKIGDGCPPAAVRFNGHRWVPARVPGTGSIGRVSALGPDDMWATTIPPLSGAAHSRIQLLHWNGSAWRIAPVQPKLPADALLSAIAVRSDSDIWTAGWAPDPKHITRELVLHWNGRTWRDVSPPSRPAGENVVQDLALDGTGGIFELVRNVTHNGNKIRSPIRHFSAGHWQAPSANNGWLIVQLGRIPGTTSIWGVGVTEKGGINEKTANGVIILHGPQPK